MTSLHKEGSGIEQRRFTVADPKQAQVFKEVDSLLRTQDPIGHTLGAGLWRSIHKWVVWSLSNHSRVSTFNYDPSFSTEVHQVWDCSSLLHCSRASRVICQIAHILQSWVWRDLHHHSCSSKVHHERVLSSLMHYSRAWRVSYENAQTLQSWLKRESHDHHAVLKCIKRESFDCWYVAVVFLKIGKGLNIVFHGLEEALSYFPRTRTEVSKRLVSTNKMGWLTRLYGAHLGL